MGNCCGGLEKVGFSRAGTLSGLQRRSTISGTRTCQVKMELSPKTCEWHNLVTGHNSRNEWGGVSRFNK